MAHSKCDMKPFTAIAGQKRKFVIAGNWIESYASHVFLARRLNALSGHAGDECQGSAGACA